MSNETKIICPNCSTEIDVNDILYNRLKSELELKFKCDLEIEKNKIAKQNELLRAEKEEFEKKKQKENELFSERLNAKLLKKKMLLKKVDLPTFAFPMRPICIIRNCGVLN